MPVLKSYTNGSGHYIHASVRGAVVTFQTTQRGVEKLASAGVLPGARFALRLLADLTRSGDAFTHRGGVDFIEAEQFEFDFKESEESRAFFPACTVTGSFEDLHLVAYGSGGERRVELLSPAPRAAIAGGVELSVPLALLSPAGLTALETSGKLPPAHETVAQLRRWYAQDASAEWERLRQMRNTRQQSLGLGIDELSFS